VIRSSRRRVSDSGLGYTFKPRLINHSPVKSLLDSVVNTSLIGPCEFVATETNVHKATCFYNGYKIHAFPHIVRFPSKFFSSTAVITLKLPTSHQGSVSSLAC
ncbi:hypothetical protein EJD97_000703, partial [Solanum chilense]